MTVSAAKSFVPNINWGPVDTFADMISDGTHICSAVPIIIPGGISRSVTPIWQATQHMGEAVYGTNLFTTESPAHDIADPSLVNGPTGKQSWIILQAWRDRPKNRKGWYTTVKYSCVAAKFSGNHCDEYPWRATSQGGGDYRDGAVNGVARSDADLPHLRIINGSHNSASGNELTAFWDACDVNDEDWFLSIPMPLEQLVMGSGLPVLDTLSMEHLAPSMFIGPGC